MKPVNNAVIKICAILFALFVKTNLSWSQESSIQWQHTYKVSDAYWFNTQVSSYPFMNETSVISNTFDEGYIICSPRLNMNYPSPCEYLNCYVSKYSKYGKLEWQSCYSNPYFGSTEHGTSIIQMSDSNYLLVTSGSNIYKFNQSGILIWEKNIGGSALDVFNGGQRTSDGGIILCGESSSTDGDLTGINIVEGGAYNAWVVKLDVDGNIQWQKCFGDPVYNELFRTVKEAPDGGYMAVGVASIHGYGIRMDKNGNPLWSTWLFGSYQEEFVDCEFTPDNQLFIAGNTESSDYDYAGAKGGNDPFIFKYSSNEGKIISKTFLFDESYDYLCGIHYTKDGLLTICGTTTSKQNILNGLHYGSEDPYFHKDIFISKIDTAGNLLFTKCYGGSLDDEAKYFVISNDNTYTIIGTSESKDGDVDYSYSYQGNDYWLFKAGGYNTIKGDAFYDYNNDLVNNGTEPFFSDVKVISEKNGGYNGMYLVNGKFSYTVDTGKIETKLQLNKPYFKVTPNPYITNHSGYSNVDSISFAVYPLPGIKDLSISLYSPRSPRPGINLNYTLICRNVGTELIKDFTMGIKLDKRVKATSHDSTDFYNYGDTIFWKRNNIEPGEEALIEINTSLERPPFLNLGDTLYNFISVAPVTQDSNIADNRDTVKQLVIDSFDPNNKMDNMGGSISLEKIHNQKYFVYTINFQNTGNAEALNITVRDTLSNFLEYKSLEMVKASHEYSLIIKDGKYLEWQFANINLPDSVHNEPMSHGFIVYRIKANQTVAAGSPIENTASIYFDYNLPVQTNTALTKVVNDLVLPAKLILFVVNKSAKENLLRWSVSEDYNIDYYIIERSNNGRGFINIGKVESSENGNLKNDYSFFDHTPNKSINYYRLKLVDKDRKYSYSDIKSINNITELQINLHPNPVKRNLILDFNSEKENKILIMVFNSEGKNVLQKSVRLSAGSTTEVVNVEKLNAGTYFIKVMNNNYEQEELIFIKN